MSFLQSIKLNSTKMLTQVDARIEEMAQELFITIVNYSPSQPAAEYSKGEFINNWMAAINRIDGSTRSAKDANGMASRTSIASLKAKRVFYRKDGRVTLANSTPYAVLVEFKGWPKSINPMWSGRVGPYAPVRKAFIHVAPKFKTYGRLA